MANPKEGAVITTPSSFNNDVRALLASAMFQKYAESYKNSYPTSDLDSAAYPYQVTDALLALSSGNTDLANQDELIRTVIGKLSFADFQPTSGCICMPLTNSQGNTMIEGSVHQESVAMSMQDFISIPKSELATTFDTAAITLKSDMDITGEGTGANDTAIPSGSNYQYIRMTLNTVIRNTLVGFIVEVRSINTLSGITDCNIYLPGINQGYLFKAPVVGQTYHILVIAAAPKRTASVTYDNAGKMGQVVRTDTRSYSFGYQSAVITGPTMTVAAVPITDAVLVMSINNANSQVYPIVCAQDNMAGLLATAARDGSKFNKRT